MSTCSSCRARITWAKSSVTGKKMPIDAEPDVAGNIVLLQPTTPGAAVVAMALTKAQLAEPASEPRYKSHFVTCPQASSWRAPKPGAARG